MKRHWLLWIGLIIFMWAIITHFMEIETVTKTLAQGEWHLLLGAGILQLSYYIVFTLLYQAAFSTVGIKARVSDLFPVTFASLFANLVPSGGTSGAALFIYAVARHGQSAARATAGSVLVQVADYSTFIPILSTGLVYLFYQHDLKFYEVIATILLLLVIIGLSCILLLGLWKPVHLRRLLTWVQSTGNRISARFNHLPSLPDDWAERNTLDFTSAATAMISHPGRLSYTVALAFVSHLINISSLYFVFLAFYHPMGMGTLVAGYAMGFLFAGVAIIPQGVGVVEGGMTLVFASLGIPVNTALVIVLAFRGLSFWIPMGAGFFLLQRILLKDTSKS
jgi:uncharacterized protein (TIRG00374 family)